MDTEPPRLALAVSALAGTVFWGMYHLATTIWARQPVEHKDIAHALANVGMGLIGGVLVAFFIGPALLPMVPLESFRDPHVVGFVTGAGAWEVAPFAYRLLRGRAARFTKGDR